MQLLLKGQEHRGSLPMALSRSMWLSQSFFVFYFFLKLICYLLLSGGFLKNSFIWQDSFHYELCDYLIHLVWMLD